MPSFRTSSLFHYTNSLTRIKGILRNGLIPNYCAEDLRYKDENNKEIGLYIGLPMVSFCDIPISKIKEYSKRYGKFAIGLKKEWVKIEGENINPILYAYNNQILKAIHNVYEEAKKAEINYYMFKDEHSKNRKAFFSGSQNIDSITINSSLLNQKKSNRDYIAKSATKDILIGYIKKYSGEYNNKPKDYYEENEWRYVVERNSSIRWIWAKKEYDIWRNEPEPKPEPTDALKKKTLTFTVDNISWIIVPTDNDILDMVEFIKGHLKKLG